ncbi:uncharacterized protein si:ch211-14c7.2 [Epinephelus moara]|uniref:uncharacterized protein si:ch211-14c7.2 n=1 Tax=Epinephelus moara TaxID=300413 RepID=UPI00214F124B|nr:uncharacterized protein si:ch211-14c7.2 [Epinephelus moara]
MRPTTSNMLQQNNNNNYPCLNVSGSTREMLQKCSRASLPFPSRLELGLGDLPLIRGLRAWALCSKNRRKAGGMLGGGQAPTAPPAGHWGSTSCPRPADVYLSGEWGRMGYGLPLGLDARQAGIGALVTVATLKTSEGSGKTQTQCLFLRTEKGSCLYSTAKPSSGVTTSGASSVVGGWLRGKTGGGGRDIPAGRRDNGQTLPTHNGVNRVRVRSGRRWRKSSNAAAREKTGVSRERQQSSREDPAEEITLEERQEERDKGGLATKQFSSPQQDSRRARQEKEGACGSPRCCHSASPKTCTQCGRTAQRRGSQDEHEGGESPRRGAQNRLNSEETGMKKERQKNEEEEKGGLCAIESSNSVLAVPSPDLESNLFQPESHSSCDVEEIKEAESNEELKTQTSHSKEKYSKTEQDTNEVMKIHTGNSGLTHGPFGQITDDVTSRHNREFETPCEEAEAFVNGLSDHVSADQELEKEMESVEEERGSINQTPAKFSVVSDCNEEISVSTCPASVSAAVSPKPSAPVEGSTCDADHETCGVRTEQENSREDCLEGYHCGVADPGIIGKKELNVSRLEQQEPTCVADENKKENSKFFFENVENSSELEARQTSSSPLRHGDPSVFETDRRIVTENGCNYGTTELEGAEQRDELVWGNREEVSHEENIEERVNPEEGDEALRRECNCNELDDGDGKGDDNQKQHTEDDINNSTIQEDNDEAMRNCALKDNWRLEESTDGCSGREEEDGDTCGQTSITYVEANGETSANVACGDPSTSLALSLVNPASSLPPLGSMATSLPWLEAEKEEEEEEEEGVGVPAGERKEGQQGKRRLGRQLKEQGEEERGSTVATEEGRRTEGEEEEEEEEEDEFGVFMQAEGEPAWSEGYTMSASVPCGSRESVAPGNHTITGELTHWTPGWMDSSFHQSDDTWTAFPQNSSDEGRDMVGRWWPTSAVEESRDRLSTNQNLASVFAEAFPSLPGSSSSDPCDLDTVPILTQLLRGKASQDQGLLDSFHDLNKMICQRYKRADGVSRDLLLRTLHLEQPHTESRPAPWTANRRLSPGLPSANQHAQNAAAKRRLSYDYNRNIME